MIPESEALPYKFYCVYTVFSFQEDYLQAV